ncbi:MAG: hypothetical protein CL678_03085 [Bdellovibrionaceae bacterium]|nr:hypothetical protein [Pseudobdellovibrionaceae bacterium]
MKITGKLIGLVIVLGSLGCASSGSQQTHGFNYDCFETCKNEDMTVDRDCVDSCTKSQSDYSHSRD